MNDNDDDEDDNFLIQEEKPSQTKSFVCRGKPCLISNNDHRIVL